MSNPPKHRNPSSQQRTALAPYNFVSLPDRVVAFEVDEDGHYLLKIDHDQYDPDRVSGWIDVELETKSPVYVRGPIRDKDYARAAREERPDDKTPHLEKVRNQPDFFHTGDPGSPQIPGSSLRGMLRSIVEILGHGKLSPVTDSALIYRAVGDTTSHGDAYRDQLFESDPAKQHHYTPRFKAGYIQRRGDEWCIQPAQAINGTTFARVSTKRIPHGLKRLGRCRNASVIYVEVGAYNFKKVRGGFIHMKRAAVTRAEAAAGPGLVKAAVVRSGRMFSKKSEAVIFDKDSSVPREDWIRIPDGSRDNEPDLVNAYTEQITPEQKRLLGNAGVLVKGHPVFYLMQGDDLVFFGHAQMFRIPYVRSPREMLPPEHRTDVLVDFAEAMFGRIPREGGAQIAGRVFVSDALLLPGQSDLWLPGGAEVIPQILAGPKPTTFQHYLTQSNPNDKRELSSYNARPNKTTLRGHKLYWHKGNVRKRDIEERRRVDQQKDTQHTRIKPVRSGVRFRFRVHFENLSLPELGLLWWAVALPADGDYCHKIGMGKPLGLGAIKLTPSLTTISRKSRYDKFLSGSTMHTGVDPAPLSAQIQQQAVALFERIVGRAQGYTTFAEGERVRQLLAMLAWPGPDPAQTRYLEIERPGDRAIPGVRVKRNGKANEYANRPVLPDPLHTK